MFGETTVRMLLSRTWTLREKAIKMIEDQIMQGSLDINDSLTTGVNVVKITISDKIVGVVQVSMALLLVLCNNSKKNLKLSQIQS